MGENVIYRVVCLTGPDNRIEPYEWIGDEHEIYNDAYEEYKKYGGEINDRIIIETLRKHEIDD